MIGDIWLTASKSKSPYALLAKWAITFIKRGKHTKYSHVMMEVGDQAGVPLLISAESGGAAFISAARYSAKTHNVSIRRNIKLTTKEKKALYNAAVRLRGAPYSELTLVGHLFGPRVAGWLAKLNRQDKICSELGGTIYDAIGYRFRKRHSKKRLPPGSLRPRDVAWDTDSGNPRNDAAWIETP